MATYKKQVKKNKAVIGGKIKWIVTIKQWIHQGFTYLDKTERLYRIIWEIIPIGVCYTLLYYGCKVPSIYSLIIAVIIAHTINWIFNYNFWTCIDFTFPSVLNPGQDETIKYLAQVQARLNKHNVITGCMLFGSLSRKVWHNKSDIDMRIIGKPGIINGLKIYLIVFNERLIAVKKKQPLDLYMADTVKFLDKMRDDEFPIFLKANDERLVQKYSKCIVTDFKKIDNLNNLL